MKKTMGIFEKTTKSGPRYQVKWRHDGVQESKTFRTMKEAKLFKAEIETSKNNGSMIDYRRRNLTVGEYLEEWVSTKVEHREKTALRRDGIIRKHIVPAIGMMKVTEVRFRDIQLLVTTWQKQGLSPYSIRNQVNTLNPMFEMAIRDKIILMNPVKGVKLPRPIRREPRVLSPAECKSLLANIDQNYRAIIHIGLATGMRFDELANLLIRDVNLFTKEINVVASKTDAGIRVVGIESVDVEVIASHLISIGRTGASPDAHVFTSPEGAALNYFNFMRRIFRPARLGPDMQDVTFHALRRTHATMLIEAGIDLKVILKRMGQTSYETLYRHYVAPTINGQRKASTAMSAYLNVSELELSTTVSTAN